MCFLLPKREDLGLIYLVASKFNALKYIWCWLAGYVFWHQRSHLSAAILLCGSIVVAFSEDTMSAYDPLTYAATVVMIVLSSRIKVRARLARVFTFLGDFSYPLYLFHLPSFILAYAGFGIRRPEFLLATALLITLLFLLLVDKFLKPRYLKSFFFG